MSKAVSNTSPLIYLTKIGAIKLAFKIFNKIVVPVGVYEEILRGKDRYKEEVETIEELVRKRELIVKKLSEENAKKLEEIVKKSKRVHRGEISAILLALQENIPIILVDDKVAYSIARSFGLKPIRTTAILLLLLRSGEINFKEFKSLLLSLVSEGYFMTADVYELIMRVADKYK